MSENNINNQEAAEELEAAETVEAEEAVAADEAADTSEAADEGETAADEASEEEEKADEQAEEKKEKEEKKDKKKVPKALRPESKAKINIFSVLTVMVFVIFIPIIVMNIAMTVQALVSPEHIPSIFGISPTVYDYEKEDEKPIEKFNRGDLLIIQDKKVGDLKVRDIVVFLVKGDDGYETGVGNIAGFKNDDGKQMILVTADDGKGTYYAPEDIEGRYIFHIPKAGSFLMFLQSPLGMVVLVVLPLGLYFLLDFLKSKHDRKKKDEALNQELEELRALKRQQEEQAALEADTPADETPTSAEDSAQNE